MEFSKETKQKVTEQIINMLTNNILEEQGGETFEGWCEDGEVFDWDEDCIALMKKVSTFVDSLSWELDLYKDMLVS